MMASFTTTKILYNFFLFNLYCCYDKSKTIYAYEKSKICAGNLEVNDANVQKCN